MPYSTTWSGVGGCGSWWIPKPAMPSKSAMTSMVAYMKNLRGALASPAHVRRVRTPVATHETRERHENFQLLARVSRCLHALEKKLMSRLVPENAGARMPSFSTVVGAVFSVHSFGGRNT